MSRRADPCSRLQQTAAALERWDRVCLLAPHGATESDIKTLRATLYKAAKLAGVKVGTCRDGAIVYGFVKSRGELPAVLLHRANLLPERERFCPLRPS